MTITDSYLGMPRTRSNPKVSSAASSPETPAHKKLRKAAQEFEGILISQLWGEFKTSLCSFSGETPLAGSDTLNSLAIQTLSTALASRGGLGIGRMLVHQLEPGLNGHGQQPSGAGLQRR